MWFFNRLERYFKKTIKYLKLFGINFIFYLLKCIKLIYSCIKEIRSIPKEIELVKKDPFIKTWRDNYTENLKLGIFKITTRVDSLEILKKRLSRNIPVILLADGPSLDKDIKVIKKMTHNFYIICQDAVLYNCLKNKIKPNLVVSLDPSILIKFFWHDLDTSDLILVASSTLNPEALKAWKGKILFFNQSDTIRYKNLVLKKMTWKTRKYPYVQNNGWVGNAMFIISVLLDPSCIILSGYDLAYTHKKYYCKDYLERRARALGISKKEVIKYEVKKELKYFDPHTENDYYTSKLFSYYAMLLLSLIKVSHRYVLNSSKSGILKGLDIINLEILEKLEIREKIK